MTFVNAPTLAAERGLQTELDTVSESPNHRSLVDAGGPRRLGGQRPGRCPGRSRWRKVVSINGRSLTCAPRGQSDPALRRQARRAGQDRHPAGEAGVNIEAAQLGARTPAVRRHGDACLDRDVPADVRAEIRDAGTPERQRLICHDALGGSSRATGSARKSSARPRKCSTWLPGVERRPTIDLGARRYYATGEIPLWNDRAWPQ